MRAIEQAVGQTRHSIPSALQLTFGQISAFVLPPNGWPFFNRAQLIIPLEGD
jgi:hypothetical protein